MSSSTKVRPPVRIVHLGLGAFFRAHGCNYLQDIGGWGVLGVSLRSSTVRDALKARENFYTSASLTPKGIELRQIDVVRNVLVAPEDPKAVIAEMANPSVSIVSLTVTEKGYCHNPASGTLNINHPRIKADIINPMPQTAPGFIVRGLQARRAAGLQPFTVISCDNLPKNGSLIRAVTIDLARYIDPDLADWINTNGAFPSSMVDRIVPATTPEDIARIETLSNQKDAAPVLHEPFSQWVITDDFIRNRPEFEKVGVQIVEDINPYETMKLRMLNGAHSALAYLGLLTGYQTVADAIADETIVRFLNKLWKKEIIPTLLAPTHLNLENYAVDLQTRFSNTMIKHQLSQIAMDGSQKLPQRILETIKDRLEHNGQIDCLLLVIAGWIAYTKDVSDKDDPFAAILRNCHTNDPEKTVSNILALHCIFDTNLTARIEATLCGIYSDLCKQNTNKLMERLIN